VKRLLKYFIIAALLACMVAGSGALGWLLGTADGVRWLFETVSRHTSIGISAGKVEGCLWNELRLGDARVRWRTGNAAVGGLRLRWHPVFLLLGKVAVSSLEVKDLRVRDDRPVSKAPPELVWPRVSGIPAWLNMRVGKLRIDGLEYSRSGGPPSKVTSIDARIMWQGNVLTIWNLALKTPSVGIDGAVMAGFRRPSLLLKFRAGTARPVAGFDGISCEARLFPGRAPEQAAGPVKVIGFSGKKQELVASADMGLARNALNVRKLRLEQPGRRGAVSGEGSLSFAGEKPVVRLRLSAAGLDLSREMHVATVISGDVSVDGKPDDYRGTFSLSNRGAAWRAGRVSGSFHGNEEGVGLTALQGMLLDGTVTGDAKADWREGIAVSGSLHGRNLNPAKVFPQWKGIVNIDLAGSAARPRTGPPRADLSGRLLESRLNGKTLAGEADVNLSGDNVVIRRLALRGKGFDARASGELRNRVNFDARIGDLSGLVPGATGKLSAAGWARWRDKRLSGSVTATGRKLVVTGLTVSSADIAASLAEGPGYPVRIDASARGTVFRGYHVDSLNLAAAGVVERHTVDVSLKAAGFQAAATLSGGYKKGLWTGWITRLSGRDAVGPWNLRSPAAVSFGADSISLSRFSLDGTAGEFLAADGQVLLHPLRGYFRTEWSSLNLARLSRLPGAAGLTGLSSGSAQVRWPGGDRLLVTARADASGTVTAGGQRLTVRRASADLDWNERGMVTNFDIRLADGGTLTGRFSSPRPAGMGIPSEGSFEAGLQGFNVALFHAWMPAGLDLSGLISGQVKGDLLPGNRLDVKGGVKLIRGAVSWTGSSGRFNAKVNAADVSWTWRGDSLAGDVTLALEEYGQARGSFRIPLAARLPAAVNPAGQVMVNVSATAMETGLLTSLFPGLIQESRGELNLEARVAGQWSKPDITGNLKLGKASAYLPTAGVQLKNVALAAHFVADRLIVDSYEVDAGPGRIGGTGSIRLKDWRVADYQGTIKGERFQVVYLPDLQVLASPDLSFSGTPGKFTARGKILVPELIVNEQQSRAPVLPSQDVVIEGGTGAAKKKPAMPLDIQVTVTLGDKVQLKLQGIEAQLKGSLKLVMNRLDEIRSTGEIRVVKGKYKTYGVSLDITRGRVYYAGGPINEPTLDIQALRKVGDVRAGVQIAGTPDTMAVKLYSEPNMPDSSILSYIILGQPLAYTSEQSGLVTRAAGQFTSTTGYKPLQAAPPGVAPSKTSGSTLSESVVSVGRYLTPELYISYGRSLLTSANLVRLRYDLSKHWEVETQTGTESGGDLFFKINFK